MSALARLRALHRERPLFVAVALVTLAWFLGYPLVDWWLRSIDIAAEFRYWDFGAYTSAIERWQSGESLYVKNESGGYHGSYLYPPAFLLLIRPFTVLPFHQAGTAWEIFSVLLLWVGLQLVIARNGLQLRWWERGVLLWALLGFQPLLLSMKLGQVAAFFTALLCFALVGILGSDRESPVSGAFTAIAGVLKLPYAPAGAHLLQDRDRFLGAVAAGGALVVVSVVAFGLGPHRTYIAVLRWGIEGGSSARPPTLWLAPYYRPFYAVMSISLPLRLGAALAIATGAVLAARTDADQATFALGAAAVPLLAPRTYTYYFVATLPAVVALLAIELKRDGYPTVPVVGVFLLSIHSFGLKLLVDHLLVWLPAVFVEMIGGVLQPGLWGNLLLVGLAAMRVKEAAVQNDRLPDRVAAYLD